MSKIAVFITTDELEATCHRVLEVGGMKSEFRFFRVDASGASRAAELAEAEGCEAIIIRRALHRPLKNASITIPVIECSLMQGEILETLYDAKMRTGLSAPHIGFFNSGRDIEHTMISIEIWQHILEARISIYDVDATNPESIRAAVVRALREKADILVASATIYAHLGECPIPTQRLSGGSADESIANAFRMAEVITASLAMERQRSRELLAIVQHSFDAVIYVDQVGRVALTNAVAENAFGLSDRTDRGKFVWDLIPQIEKTRLESVIGGGEDVFGEILEIRHGMYAVNITSVLGGGVAGAIINCNELKRIENLEAKAKSELHRKGHVAKYGFDDMIGDSTALREAKYFAAEFARHDSTILILGESGSGKELFAHSIHRQSARREYPFVAINCAALPLTLLESELFGYAEGAFTGAARSGKKGLFEIADRGSIFLDEISELDLSGQVRLLRVLAERSVQRVGDSAIVPVDVRVIAASNRDLSGLVEKGLFREDLYYRLNVLTVQVPPLRERHGDVAALANHFFADFGKKTGKYVSLGAGAQALVEKYPWPGNVRQLRNFCERVAIVARTSVVEEDFIRSQLRAAYGDKWLENDAYPASPLDFSSLEKEQIIRLLAAANNSRKKVAEELGVSKSTLWRKMKQYGLV